MNAPSTTHLVLIPSFNPGRKVYDTLAGARQQWAPVWIVVDGSTDGTGERLEQMAATDPHLRVIRLPHNGGKGGAVLHGLELAEQAGFTHALALDSDGQHPTDLIPAFMAASIAAPTAMILGEPQFDASAPSVRVKGRRISNWWTNVWTLWAGIHDSLFGFRVYPIGALVQIMRRQIWMRRFDFDVEAAVRLSWRGVPAVNLPAPVRYFRPGEGGVSHFRYLRDNLLLTSMHARLLLGFVLRLPILLIRRFRSDGSAIYQK
jgi:glycosyltransferase involved in cell wall biosynthesis